MDTEKRLDIDAELEALLKDAPAVESVNVVISAAAEPNPEPDPDEVAEEVVDEQVVAPQEPEVTLPPEPALRVQSIAHRQKQAPRKAAPAPLAASQNPKLSAKTRLEMEMGAARIAKYKPGG